MKSSRAQFKWGLKRCKKNKDEIVANKIAECMLTKNDKDFWKSVKARGKGKQSLPLSVGGCNGPKDICEMWKRHYENLLNSVKNEMYKRSVESEIAKTKYDDLMLCTPEELVKLIKELPLGKSCGPDNLCAEHLVYCDGRLPILLSLLFSSMFIHGFIPNMLMTTTIVPLVKDQNEDLSDTNNYRPIALGNIIAKLLEKIIYTRISDFLATTDNQFG